MQATASSTGHPRWIRIVLGIGCVAALAPLAWLDPGKRQMGLYFSWLAAMVLYLLQWKVPRGVVQWRPSRLLIATLIAYGLVLFVGFCAVYDNWRWAVTGDSLLFYGIGEELARGNPAINWLGAQGVFEQATVVQATLQNAFMNINVSLFTHRLGNLLTSTLLVLAAAGFAAEASGATAGVLLGLFLPLNWVFAEFTLISLPNLSAVLPYYALYALFLVAWRVWTSDFLWAALGLTTGLALYFAPLWFGAGLIVSAAVVASAVYWRRLRILGPWLGGILVAGLPGLLQLPTLLHVWFIFRPAMGLSIPYALQIAWQIVCLPFKGEIDAPWIAPPFGALVIAGIALALVSGLAALFQRARGRVLQSAWLWLVPLAADIGGLSLANSGYPAVSLKRAIVMLPCLSFLLVLPLAWLSERVGRAWLTASLAAAALIPYAYLNAWELQHHEFGFNITDGLVRMAQTSPGRVLLLSAHPDLDSAFGPDPDPGGQADGRLLIQRMFHPRSHIVNNSVIPSRREDFDRVVCFSSHFDGPEWAAKVRGAMEGICPGKPVEQITGQLECVTCDP